ncbi:MAG: hypothetical protein KAJ70_02155 [Candidatus Omnitrophica bacterium]|nr:hypothetical protein [Candidatus Omnitrophota bacterium]
MDEAKNEKMKLDGEFRQLQELRSIGIIANRIVHDFNNTIGIIRGYADLALRVAPVSDRGHNFLEKIIEETDSARKLAEKLRIFTRQRKADFKLISSHLIVGQAIQIFRESLPALMDIQQDIDTTGTTVFADAGQIQQVVTGLCNNAYDALCENDGSLKISLKEEDVKASFAEEYKHLNEGKYVKLTVSDTGRGMDQATMERIFEPFFTTKEAGQGAGLGLSVVHGIVMNHHGEIIVDSRLGKGTTVRVYLPLADNDIKREEEGK